jgi:hypothetical protein
MGTGGPFPGGKARLGRDADHSPLSSAEVVNEQELYLLSPQAPPWRVEGVLYFTYFYFWDVLPCKIIVDRRFRGTCCHGSTSQKTILNFKTNLLQEDYLNITDYITVKYNC